MRKVILASASMLLFSFSLMILQMSCKKEANAQSQSSNCLSTQPKLQFKVNGALKNCDAIFSDLVGWDKCPILEIAPYPQQVGSRNWRISAAYGRESAAFGGDADGISIDGNTSTPPTVGTVQSTRCGGKFDGVSYPQGNITIIFTSISGNRASGTFSGTLRHEFNGMTVSIADGAFSNIPMGSFDWDIRF
jgi:hypothetical protein